MIKSIDEAVLETALRRMPIDRLRLLRLFTRPERFISSTLISTATISSFRKLGGTVSSLVRTKVVGEPVVRPVGKSKRQAILELNENLIPKQILKKVLDKIGAP